MTQQQPSPTTDERRVDPAQTARDATLHSFLNCYRHETGTGKFVDAADAPVDRDPESGLVLRCPLEHQGLELLVPVDYRSATGRHLFDLPGYYRPVGGEDVDRGEAIEREVIDFA